MNKILFIFLLLAACESIYQPPTDLVISNPVWTRTDLNHIYDEIEVCEHDFTINNSSDHLIYDQIVVRISYFDHQHRLLNEALGKISRPIKPHESYRVKGMSGGHVGPETDSASVNLVKAVVKPVKKLRPVQ